MTRKRTRENLVQQLCEPCSYCEGRGYVLSPESVAFKILREIRKDLPRFCGRQVALCVSPEVAEMLLGPARKALAALGQELGREIEVRARPSLHQEQFELVALDQGPPVELRLAWLGSRGEGEAGAGGPAPAPPAPEEAAPAVLDSAPGALESAPGVLDSPPESPILPLPDPREGSS
jgi:hypothetical protein